MSLMYIPRRQSPWANVMPSMLGNLILQQIGHKQRMDIMDKQLTAQKQATEVEMRMGGLRQPTTAELTSGVNQEKVIRFNDKDWIDPGPQFSPLVIGGKKVPDAYVVEHRGKVSVHQGKTPPQDPKEYKLYQLERQQAEMQAGPGGLQDFPDFGNWLIKYRRAGAMQVGEKVDVAGKIEEARKKIQAEYKQKSADETFGAQLWDIATKRIMNKSGRTQKRQYQRNQSLLTMDAFEEADIMVQERFERRGKRPVFRADEDPPGWYDSETGEFLAPWSRNYPHRFKTGIR